MKSNEKACEMKKKGEELGNVRNSTLRSFYIILCFHIYIFSYNRITKWVKTIYMVGHRTIIRTGITCKKIPCYKRDSACRWLIVENTTIFRSYVKHFLIISHERNCRILIGLRK